MVDIKIESYDPREVSDGFLATTHAIKVEADAEARPHEPPMPFGAYLAVVRAPSGSHRTVQRFVARQGGEVVGIGLSVIWRDQSDTGLVSVAVRGDRRGEGVGAVLLDHAIGQVTAAGRTMFIIDAPAESPFEPALRRLGMRDAIRERVSRLDIADLDRDLMQAWVDRAAERASDYELITIDDRVPDQYLEAWCAAEESMNTAPLEDLEFDDETMTPDRWRSIEQTAAASGLAFRAMLALHRPSGEAAGLTTLYVRGNQPVIADQDDTVTIPNHRNRGIGRWLKAANISRVADEFPAVEHVFTGNADSNQSMLAINEAMGFRPAVIMVGWQGSVAAARAHLQRQ